MPAAAKPAIRAMPIVEFKLGLRGNATVPPRADEAWCGYIGRLLRAGSASGANTPAFDCSKVRAGGSETVVYRDPGQRIFLSSSLDRSANDCSNG